MSRRPDASKKGSKGMLNDPKVMEALDRLFEEAPMQYYTEAIIEWVIHNEPDKTNEEMYRRWRLHMNRLLGKNAVKELREDFVHILEKILRRGVGALDIKIAWEEWHPTVTFRAYFKDMRARIVVDDRGAIGYEIYMEGDGIFVDLTTKKVVHDPKLGSYNRVYGLFNYESLGDLDLVFDALSKDCRKSPNINECRRAKIEQIKRDLGWSGGGRA